MEKSTLPKNLGCICNYKKTCPNLMIGENSPNLVTLPMFKPYDGNASRHATTKLHFQNFFSILGI
jgi:hypothetical protein